MKVAVIGGGVMGLATGWALRRRGHEPVVYEQFRVGNERGSSHGRSRIFRLAYAEDDYVRLAQESLGLWRELEARDRRDGARAERPGRGRADARGEHRPHARALRRRVGAARREPRPRSAYPIRVPEGSFVVVQPEAGIVRADKALAAFAQGLDVREDSRVRPDELDADAVVVTAGPWVNELLDEPLPVKMTRETLCVLPARGRPADPVGRLVQAGPAHARDVLAARP